MAKAIPKRLQKEPLIESLWEIRFSSEVSCVAELLPGLLYKEFVNEFPTIEILPSSTVPQQWRTEDQFRYLPTVRMTGLPYTIQVGEHVVSLSCGRPYSGWDIFGEKIKKLAKILKETNLITRPERYSIKCIDILPLDGTPSITPLELLISLAGKDIASDPVFLRTEQKEDDLLHIVQIICPAQVQLMDGDQTSGIFVDIDTIYNDSTDHFWQNLTEQLQKVHDANKRIFFELLKNETITTLKPEY
jgi:uncharacterized protein (TIGR04255 family)